MTEKQIMEQLYNNFLEICRIEREVRSRIRQLECLTGEEKQFISYLDHYSLSNLFHPANGRDQIEEAGQIYPAICELIYRKEERLRLQKLENDITRLAALSTNSEHVIIPSPASLVNGSTDFAQIVFDKINKPIIK